MKKIAIFLTMFLFFSAIAAETVSNEVKPQENTDHETAAKDDAAQTEEAPKKFYFQPALGIGTGLSIFRTTLAMDMDFLLKRSKSGVGIYMGLDFDLRYMTVAHYDNLVEVALQANGVMDMDLKNQRHLKSLSVWMSFGLLMIMEQDYHDDYDLTLRTAWGMGTDLVFKNDMILKLGLDAFLGFYPDLTVAVGYRF